MSPRLFIVHKIGGLEESRRGHTAFRPAVQPAAFAGISLHDAELRFEVESGCTFPSICLSFHPRQRQNRIVWNRFSPASVFLRTSERIEYRKISDVAPHPIETKTRGCTRRMTSHHDVIPSLLVRSRMIYLSQAINNRLCGFGCKEQSLAAWSRGRWASLPFRISFPVRSPVVAN